MVSGSAIAAPFDGAVDSSASSAELTADAELATAGSLIGDYHPDTNPGGTQTRPGLFGGSGNNPIPTTADFDAAADLQTQPAGSLAIEADFDALTIDLDGLVLDILNGSQGGTDLAATLEFSTFNTINPSFIYPGGTPISQSLGEVATISRAEFVQTAPAAGLMVATDDPDVFSFVAVIEGEASLTLSVGLPGSVPTPNDIDAVPFALPSAGTVTRMGDGTIRLTISGSGGADDLNVPVDQTALPPVPLELPTFGSATAGVLLTLTPQSLVFSSAIDVSLVIEATPATCQADWNSDGLTNFFDLVDYIADYNARTPGADLAPPAGAWNFFDVSAFLGIYNAGCP
jgi:hypothetical protein